MPIAPVGPDSQIALVDNRTFFILHCNRYIVCLFCLPNAQPNAFVTPAHHGEIEVGLRAGYDVWGVIYKSILVLCAPDFRLISSLFRLISSSAKRVLKYIILFR